MRDELIHLLENTVITCDYFIPEGDVYADQVIVVENENDLCAFQLEVRVTVKFEDYKDYDFHDVMLEDFTVFNENNEEVVNTFLTDSEIETIITDNIEIWG